MFAGGLKNREKVVCAISLKAADQSQALEAFSS